MFATLDEPATRGDARLVTRQAHTLKSSAAMVGALQLSALARRLEADAKEGRLAALDSALGDLRTEFSRVCVALESRSEAAHATP
jgi:HPt (histidine-containing phosphotransfer) domain-containing protein